MDGNDILERFQVELQYVFIKNGSTAVSTVFPQYITVPTPLDLGRPHTVLPRGQTALNAFVALRPQPPAPDLTPGHTRSQR